MRHTQGSSRAADEPGGGAKARRHARRRGGTLLLAPTFSALVLCLGRRSIAAKNSVSCTDSVAYSRSSCVAVAGQSRGQAEQAAG